jgi:uncharacterized protein involved in exopolysaccharide biosynthesis
VNQLARVDAGLGRAEAADGASVAGAPPSVSVWSYLGIVLRHWPVLFVGVAIPIGLAFAYMSMLPPRYTVAMVLAPSEMRSSSFIEEAAPLQAISALRFLPDSEQVSQLTEFRWMLTSPDLAQRVEERYGFLRRIYPDLWDERNQRWRDRTSKFPYVNDVLADFLGLPPKGPPTYFHLAQFLQENLVVRSIERSGLTAVTLELPDPVLAKDLLTALHAEGETVLRERELESANRQIAYIEGRMSDITTAETRLALIGVLNERLKTSVVASQSDVPFAVSAIQEPTVNPDPTWPKPLRTLVIVSLLSAIIVSALIILWHRARRGPAATAR